MASTLEKFHWLLEEDVRIKSYPTPTLMILKKRLFRRHSNFSGLRDKTSRYSLIERFVSGSKV